MFVQLKRFDVWKETRRCCDRDKSIESNIKNYEMCWYSDRERWAQDIQAKLFPYRKISPRNSRSIPFLETFQKIVILKLF